MTQQVNVFPGLAYKVATGGAAIAVTPTKPYGGVIVNPLDSADQGIGSAEPIYIDPTGIRSTLVANGSSFAIEPGQYWILIPGQTSPIFVNAATSGHKFAVIYWMGIVTQGSGKLDFSAYANSSWWQILEL